MLKLNNIKVGHKLAIMVAVSVLGLLVMLWMAASTLETKLIAEKQVRLQAVISATLSQIKLLHKTLPEDQAKQQAKQLINAVRYDGNNYIFAIDESRYTVTHPNDKLIGQQMGETGDSSKDQMWFDMVALGSGGNTGSLTYPWHTSDGKPADKISVVHGYAPWGWILGSGMLINDIQAAINAMLLQMVTATAAVLAILVGLGFVISRAIVKPLEAIKDAMGNVANGDLTTEVPVPGRDEIGVVAYRVNQSIRSVRDALVESVNSAATLSEAAIRIASSAEETSQAVTSQRDQLNQLSTAMNEMSATVAEVASHAEESAKDSSSATDKANVGDKDVDSSIVSIQDLTVELEKAAQYVQNLKEGVMQISEVTTVIGGISEQTNLLALNAAIEAARAGEQGRGFAVVADEVRNLASRTHTSTDEIHTTIQNLQNLAIQTAGVMESSQKLAHNSVESATHCGKDLSSIVAHIQTVRDKSTHIATAAEEQSMVAEEMNRNVSMINDSALEMSEAAGYLAAESEILADMSRQLDGKLASFKLA